MKLSKQQESSLINLFKSADDVRLMHGPDDKESLFLHGVMLGIRETLESKEVELKGVTGLWWYEELGNSERQKSTNELIEAYGSKGKMASLLLGREKGEKQTLEILRNFNLLVFRK